MNQNRTSVAANVKLGNEPFAAQRRHFVVESGQAWLKKCKLGVI